MKLLKELNLLKDFDKNNDKEVKKTFEEKKKDELLNRIGNKYSLNELETISKSHTEMKEFGPSVLSLNKHTDVIKFAAMGDTHMGSKYFSEDVWDEAIRICEEEDVDFITHVGDLTEGMSHRPGHVYELDKIGYSAQKEYAIKMLSKTKKPIYGIDGNHDRWFIKQSGAIICKEIANTLDNYHFIGHDEGDIIIDNIKIKLWHGEDGNSYATSYRVQKIIESLTGGEKPHVLLCGHTHKALYLPLERNVLAFSTGALSSQSKWMRSKKLANHSGFWIITLKYNSKGVYSCIGEFKPFYVED